MRFSLVRTAGLAVALAAAACNGRVPPQHTPARATGAQASLAVPAVAADGSFAPVLTLGERELLRNGSGLCEWGVFGIDLYTAALYSERPVRSLADALDPDQCLVFHLSFLRGLSAAQLSKAFTASTKVNAGDDFASYEPALARLTAAMRTVRAGDTYSFFCEPGRGLAIAYNGSLVDRVEDEAFRRLFATLYLGDHPPTKALRRGLLGI